MKITNEKRYALRAVFELAKRDGSGPVKSADIARAQGIPARFLEVILCKLTRIGLVKSKRGYQGGFVLGRSAREITVGSVFEPLESAVCPEGTMHCAAGQGCPFSGTCVFLPLWNRVQRSIHEVYRNTTIQDLLNGEGVLPPALLGEKPGEVSRGSCHPLHPLSRAAKGCSGRPANSLRSNSAGPMSSRTPKRPYERRCNGDDKSPATPHLRRGKNQRPITENCCLASK